jgi:hypothetical protein
MSINQVYDTWLKRVKQLRPKERVTRLRNCAWTLSGIFRSRSVHLRRVAEKMPGRATTNSKIRRLSRFLDNPALRVRHWYAPVAGALLQTIVAHGLEVRLLVDGTKVGFGHQLLMVAVAYRRRALPVAWTWVKGNRGHSSAYKQRALLAYVRRLLPSAAQVIVVGDSEFGAVSVLRQLEAWGWQYVLRQKSNHQVLLEGQATRQPFGTLIDQPGQRRWCVAALLTQKHAYPTKLLAHWQKGEREPWLLATNLSTPRATLRAYRRRMWVDEMFGDFKRNGFDLESSHLRHFLRLSRLTLMVAFLYLWLVARGSQIIKSGQRRLVDRRDRRDLSIFSIGLSMIERYLANARLFSIRLLPYFL